MHFLYMSSNSFQLTLQSRFSSTSYLNCSYPYHYLDVVLADFPDAELGEDRSDRFGLEVVDRVKR